MFDRFQQDAAGPAKRIAVVGAGISGLSAAWLLSQRHEVVLFEAEDRPGGHSCTVQAPSPDGPVAVDTGFIVYNAPNYPNFTALLDHLGVASTPAHMSFAVSMDDGGFEYSSHGVAGLFAQKRNLASPRFLRMLLDVTRFHRTAVGDLDELDRSLCSLGQYLDDRKYGRAFRELHLLPQAAAIWSSTPRQMADYPAAAFIRFYQNHRLLEVDMAPNWRTVAGGSTRYVQALVAAFRGQIRLASPVTRIERDAQGVSVHSRRGAERFNEVVLAVHSDQALAILAEPSAHERRLLTPMAYGRNRVVLHRDRSLMPYRQKAWAAWNYVGGNRSDTADASVTYWMNLLQGLPGPDLFVTLNPDIEPDPGLVLADREFDHPIFNAAALVAQRDLGSLQGRNNTWFCGAWFGSGFHEDGLQAGLAVAEAIGGVRRPWTVENESARIPLPQPTVAAA